jgi:hypothetical protein
MSGLAGLKNSSSYHEISGINKRKQYLFRPIQSGTQRRAQGGSYPRLHIFQHENILKLGEGEKKRNPLKEVRLWLSERRQKSS